MPRVNIDLDQKGDWKVAPTSLRGDMSRKN
jgi:hypothetical protein